MSQKVVGSSPSGRIGDGVVGPDRSLSGRRRGPGTTGRGKVRKLLREGSYV